MTKETWEVWHDDYQDYMEGKRLYEDSEVDDLEEWKKAEQLVIDTVINKLKDDYYG
tara:strand:- start:529 stop:696 length:168 start_codon:yes stop_codon:yes gene_type:complete